MAETRSSDSTDRSSSRASSRDRDTQTRDRLSDRSREALSSASDDRRDRSPEVEAETVTQTTSPEEEHAAAQERLAAEGRAAKERVDRQIAQSQASVDSPAQKAWEARRAASREAIREAITSGIERARANPTPAGSYQLAQAQPATMTDATPPRMPGQIPPTTGTPANDNRAPATQARPAAAARPAPAARPVPGVGLAAVALALEAPGLRNLSSRDMSHLNETYGFQLDPRNPVDAEITMEYTLNRGRSEMTRAIADRITRSYAPSTMPEAEAVAIVEERMETRAAERTAAAIAALSADTPRMEDDACAPGPLEGNWELASRPSMSDAARNYQRQISRTPDLGTTLVEYRVTDPATGSTALFDGCAHWSPSRELLEAKHGYGDLIEASRAHGFPLRAQPEAVREAERQFNAVGATHPVEWHLSDPRSAPFFQEVLSEGAPSPNFSVHVTPAQ